MGGPSARAEPGAITLEAERRIPRSILPDDLVALGRIRRRRELERSALYRRLADRVDEVTRGLEHARPASPAPRPDGVRFLRALTWNIERGNRLDAIKAYLGAEPRVRDVDLVLLNEVDIGMARSQNRDVAAELAELLGFEYVFGNSYLCLGHGDARDGTPGLPNERGLHGNAILSRWPLVRAENVSVAVSKDKFESSEKRLGHKKALWADVRTPLGDLCVIAAHLDPYTSPEVRRAQMADVLAAAKARSRAPAALLGGDLNTTTYDLHSLPRLFGNVAAKLWRGGFPHAVDHYMRPQALYERGIFDELAAHGFATEAFNAMGQGSVRYEVNTFDSESKVKDHLPAAFVHLLRYKLRPWNGSVPLKIDWFAGRGLDALGAGERAEPGGRTSLAPQVLERAAWRGERISDHDPVLVDVAPR